MDPPTEKKGYARKQSKPEVNFKFFLEEDNRRCIKLYNEEIPVKKFKKSENAPEKNQVDLTEDSVEMYKNKLEKLFSNAMKKDLNEDDREKSPEVGGEIAEEVEKEKVSIEFLTALCKDLDKARKLTNEQIKVFENLGVTYQTTLYEPDPWKIQSKMQNYNRNHERKYNKSNDKGHGRIYDQNYDRNHDRKKNEFNHKRNYQKPKKSLADAPLEKILEAIPLQIRPKFFPETYTIKKLAPVFSLRKTFIEKRNNDAIINNAIE